MQHAPILQRPWDTLQYRAQPSSRRTLTCLANDTLVDFVFSQLSVRDIIRLRQVRLAILFGRRPTRLTIIWKKTCKLFYELTHQPMVWKRILTRFPLPLPPMPPTARYNFSSLSSLETERMILRALTLDSNWRSKQPRAYVASESPAFHDVLSMKMAPGGQYMVASVRDAGPNNYALMLFLMEHRAHIGYPIAKVRTRSKAYHLHVKYTNFQGEAGIMICYARREPKNKPDRRAK